jgi:hypothetical protein
MSAMISRLLVLSALLSTLSGCVVIPRTEMTQRIDFNYVTYPEDVLSYNDLMCCAECSA